MLRKEVDERKSWSVTEEGDVCIGRKGSGVPGGFAVRLCDAARGGRPLACVGYGGARLAG